MLKARILSLFFYSCIIFLIIACKHAVIPLSKEEAKLKDSIKNICKCDLFFEHDYNAIIKHKNDGVFSIQFISDEYMKKWCYEDTLFLRKFSLEIAQKLNKVITYRNCYRYIEIGFTNSRQEDRRSVIECDISFKFSLADF